MCSSEEEGYSEVDQCIGDVSKEEEVNKKLDEKEGVVEVSVEAPDEVLLVVVLGSVELVILGVVDVSVVVLVDFVDISVGIKSYTSLSSIKFICLKIYSRSFKSVL